MTRLFAVWVLAVSLFNNSSKVAISIINFSLTSTSLGFEISGTFPNLAPATSPNALYLVNPNPAASPGFALGDFLISSTESFSGSQVLWSGYYTALGTGNPNAGDYVYLVFSRGFAEGEAINGVVEATWGTAAFDPSAVSMLNVFWGDNESLPVDPSTQPSAITGGTFLSSIVVPEPSSLSLFLAGGAVLMAGRRRMV